jgi:hypothetical protein
MTTLFVIPGAALLFFWKEKFSQGSIGKALSTVPFFSGVMVLLYSYLPLRASQNPAIDWGHPVNWENFWRHFTGKQYQVWFFSSSESARKQLAHFISNLPVEFAYIGLAVALIGFFYARRRSRPVFWFGLTSFLVTVFYSIQYDISDIDAYFILAYVSLALFAAFGFAWLFEVLKSRTRARILWLPILAVPVLLQLGVNFPKADQSRVYVYEDYTKAVLGNVEPNAVIFSYQWDYFISASLYFQQVEGFRKDVAVIDKELLRRRWYFHQLENNYPDVVSGIQAEIKSFTEALKPFERGERYNSDLLETSYQAVMTRLVAANSDQRPCASVPNWCKTSSRRGIQAARWIPGRASLAPVQSDQGR